MLAVLYLQHTVCLYMYISIYLYIYIVTDQLSLQASKIGKYTVLLHIMVYPCSP